MNPAIQPLPTLFKTSGRRRNIVSALVAGLFLLLGVSNEVKAAPRPFDTYEILVTINNAIADGTSIDKVTVRILDVNGNPVTGQNITFAFGGLNFPATIDPTGTIYFFTPSSNDVGSTTVTIKLNGIPIGTATVTFVAGPPSTSNPQTQLIVDHSPETANGVNQDKVHLHIVDQWGNIVANTLVNALFYVVPNGDPAALTAVLSGGGGSVMTDANGDVFLTITNITAGTVQIGATINGSVVGNTVNVVFTSDVPDVTNPQTRLVVDVSPAVADGVQQDKIHAHLVDKNGNVVANQTVTMTFSVAGTGTADGTAVLTYTATGKTDANGNVYLTITNIKTGTVDITATVNGNAITYGSPAEVVFISDVPDVTNPETKLVVDVTKQAADGVAQDKIHAHLVDKNGNIVANQTVTMTFSLAGTGTAEGTAVLTYTATVTTDANGNAYLIITNTKVGTVGLTATVNGKAITYGSPATVEFITNPPVANPPSSATDPTYYIVTADNKTADGTSQDMVKVHLTDNINVVPNWPVTFTITGGSAASTAFFIDPVTGAKTAGSITVNTNAAGEILLPIVDTKVGDVIIKATIVVNGVTEELILSPRTVHFVVGQPSANPPGNPSGGTTFWVDQDNAVADLIAQDILKAHISDDFGNHVGAGVAVVFTITGGPAAANALFYNGGTPITGPITLYTDANGDISFPMIDKTAGGVIVKAELNGVEIHNSPQTAHFIAGPAVPSAPNAPTGMGTWLTVTQNNMAADGKKVDSVKAHITDQYGNPVANETVTFTIITGGGAEGGALFQPGGVATTITIKTDANGNAVAAISDTKAGDVWVVASIVYGGTPTLIDGSHVVATFTEAPDVNNEDTRLIVIIYQALADGTSTTSVKAHVVDKAGNPLPGWDVTFKIDSGSATIVTPQPVTTDANGDAYITITSTTPGYVLITATVNDESIKFGSPARVKFAPINIYVPRVFTPNGDGNNDVLKPILVGIKEFHYFSVYNRWGNLIFTTEDANRGWDGTFKGVPQPVETYLWIAEGIDVKGSKIVQKGMTSLVK